MPTGKHTPLQRREPPLPQRPLLHTYTCHPHRHLPKHTTPPAHSPSFSPNTQTKTNPGCHQRFHIKNKVWHAGSSPSTIQADSLEAHLTWYTLSVKTGQVLSNFSLEIQAPGTHCLQTPFGSRPPSEGRARRPEEHTHCKSDLAVLLAQVAQVSRDVGLQPQVLSVHSILLEGKDLQLFSFLSDLKRKLSNFDFGCKKIGEPKEFKHFSFSPENTASVNL